MWLPLEHISPSLASGRVTLGQQGAPPGWWPRWPGCLAEQGTLVWHRSALSPTNPTPASPLREENASGLGSGVGVFFLAIGWHLTILFLFMIFIDLDTVCLTERLWFGRQGLWEYSHLQLQLGAYAGGKSSWALWVREKPTGALQTCPGSASTAHWHFAFISFHKSALFWGTSEKRQSQGFTWGQQSHLCQALCAQGVRLCWGERKIHLLVIWMESSTHASLPCLSLLKLMGEMPPCSTIGWWFPEPIISGCRIHLLGRFTCTPRQTWSYSREFMW